MTDQAKDDKSLIDSIKLIVGKEERINEQLDNDKGLKRYAKDLLLLVSLVKDYYQGHYRDIPYKTISAAVVGLLYVINPIDIIPDFIPLIGQLDDALVLGFCLKLIEKDLHKYKIWKDSQSASGNKMPQTQQTNEQADSAMDTVAEDEKVISDTLTKDNSEDTAAKKEA